MRTTMIVAAAMTAAGFIGLAAPAHADAADDYMDCLRTWGFKAAEGESRLAVLHWAIPAQNELRQGVPFETVYNQLLQDSGDFGDHRKRERAIVTCASQVGPLDPNTLVVPGDPRTPAQMEKADCEKFESDLKNPQVSLAMGALDVIAGDIPSGVGVPAALAICGIQAGVNDVPNDLSAFKGVVGKLPKVPPPQPPGPLN